ncbi:MAG: hypothetical protein A2487_06110 [Candidatus Raymondbacteria bacterium RifOxyC12_full_50_8]|uniref:TonB C-terminal domain-containing protein n=1 Tax=Candidatus Raymondbacteria bacterium RIFOXYD12_FULL_49_13 TaxID=1817890 RepID=A0A1F7F9B0_UNCRA|nr:MAG: hypothetical protein A2248_18635 [Candidatus Raymondbacteria bacterium RIFOXYA2_FULL_49_16]OGJ98592.1 MAG: hypothetical protein A2350_14150 [Candidatus Raymondbacteria bacterium RifOxyB12_full_50_8]OGJ99476.1 MAG: hypothetical protein A2487_06110 [Candidatus Raymondbacteria bacterium RifOxyC12_full_50_8]OGK03264.1 MAG: hypothetical protein A2519_13130 [Candidatus Raymondbacteria bacterium RIFOXYD12_FULL_49_13]OGP41537.1 MAG: hypothetical protein A2324_09650 [Candidatus Raymondbacteria b
MSDQRLVAVVQRKDIFLVDDDRRMGVIMAIFLAIGMMLGVWFSTMEVVEVVSDFFENLPPELTAKLVVDVKKDEKKEEKKEKKKEDKMKKKVLKAQELRAKATGGVGKGDIRQKVTQKGLLAIVSGKASSNAVAGAAFQNNVFSKDLDAILDNVGGLKTAGQSAVGRMGKAGGQFNMGYTGGGGAGGIDDLLNGLAGEAAGVSGLRSRSRDIDLPNSASFWNSQDGLNGRNPQDIYRVVMQHIGGLRHEYNKRLRDKPGLKGKITVKFTIAQSGRVLMCKLVESTMGDPTLEQSVVEKIKTWKFGPCSKCGIATVTYPFAFSQ